MRKALFSKLVTGSSAIFGDPIETGETAPFSVRERVNIVPKYGDWLSIALTSFQETMKEVDVRLVRKGQLDSKDVDHDSIIQFLQYIGEMPIVTLHTLLDRLGISQKLSKYPSWCSLRKDIRESSEEATAEAFRRLPESSKDVIRGRAVSELVLVLNADPKRFWTAMRDLSSEGAKFAVPYAALLDPSFQRPTVSIVDIDQRRVLLEYGTQAKRTFGRLEDEEKENEVDDKLISLIAEWVRLPKKEIKNASHDEQAVIRHATDLALVGSLWANGGFPQVTLGHKLAASLMATEIAKDLVPELHLPWETFVIVVPSGLIPNVVYIAISGVRDVDGHIRLMCGVTKNFVPGDGSGSSTKQSYGFSASWTLHSISDLTEPSTFSGYLGCDDQEEVRRKSDMIHRLALGVLLELQAYREKAGEFPSRPSSKSSQKSSDGAPAAFTFELRRDVKIDARPYVAAYLAGHGKSPAVQLLVRGHSKRQVCGKGRLGRKIVWIEPYWKGSDDLPIAVRSHVLESKKTG